MDVSVKKSETVNFKFIEEYKRLDNLLADAYSVNNGITNYIDIMKNTSPYEYRSIQTWERDLQDLKKFRYIRNQLVHENDTFDRTMCDEDDIIWIQDFYQRVIQGTDPLSVLTKIKNEKKQNSSGKAGSDKLGSDNSGTKESDSYEREEIYIFDSVDSESTIHKNNGKKGNNKNEKIYVLCIVVIILLIFILVKYSG